MTQVTASGKVVLGEEELASSLYMLIVMNLFKGHYAHK